MTRADILRQKLILPQTPLLGQITTLGIAVIHSPDAISRGIPTRVAEDLSFRLEAVRPLFAAGFCASETTLIGAAATFDVQLEGTETGFSLNVTGAAHGPRLLYVLLLLIESQSQTPAGAFERLLDLMDGDEEMAKEVFKPLVFASDVATIAVDLSGVGDVQAAFDVATVPLNAQLDPLAAAMPKHAERVIFEVPETAGFTDAIDHGFMSLHDAGCFHPSGTQPNEPEIFVQQSRLFVDEWTAHTDFVAELIYVVTKGQTAPVRILSTGTDP